MFSCLLNKVSGCYFCMDLLSCWDFYIKRVRCFSTLDLAAKPSLHASAFDTSHILEKHQELDGRELLILEKRYRAATIAGDVF